MPTSSSPTLHITQLITIRCMIFRWISAVSFWACITTAYAGVTSTVIVRYTITDTYLSMTTGVGVGMNGLMLMYLMVISGTSNGLKFSET